MRLFLDEKWPQLQRQKMVRKTDLIGIASRDAHFWLTASRLRFAPSERRSNVKLSRAAGTGPALPAIQHLAEFAGGHLRNRVGIRNFVGVGGRRGAQPARLAVFPPAPRLRPTFAGGEIAGEIAGGECDGERNDQCNNG